MAFHRKITVLTLLSILTPSAPAIGLADGPPLSPGQFRDLVGQLAQNSPSGGPKKHPQAAVLIYCRKSRRLCWLTPTGNVSSVPVVAPLKARESEQYGPTPLGEYLIGPITRHQDHNIDWCRLFPRKEDNTGYYNYHEKTQKGRSEIALHPGRTSLGCVTVYSETREYNASANWKKVRQVLNRVPRRYQYKKFTFIGYLFVVDR